MPRETLKMPELILPEKLREGITNPDTLNWANNMYGMIQKFKRGLAEGPRTNHDRAVEKKDEWRKEAVRAVAQTPWMTLHELIGHLVNFSAERKILKPTGTPYTYRDIERHIAPLESEIRKLALKK